MIEFVFPNSQELLPTFPTNCPGLILPRIPPPTPVLYSAVTHPLLGYVCTQNTAKPTPKLPFSWPELERGQNELPSEKFRPQLGKMGKTFLEVGKKKLFVSSTGFDNHLCLGTVSLVTVSHHNGVTSMQTHPAVR